MYEEYLKAYRHYRESYGADTAIFYLVGKFYELYDCASSPQTPIRCIVDLLNIQLSVRRGEYPTGEDGLFAGIPEQSLHKYASRLTGAGWTVVVFEQVKDTKGAVKERTVARILTPGTHTEAATGADACIFAAIWLEPAVWGSNGPPAFGLAALDLTTGSLTTFEGTAVGKVDSWTADDAFHFFQVHAPRETVLFWRGQPLDCPTDEQVRRQFGLLSSKLHIKQADPSTQGGFETPLGRENLLRRTIRVRGLLPLREALGIHDQPRTERVLCALLHRVEELFPSAPNEFSRPEVWSPATSLYLGNHALIQLNMIAPTMEDSVLGLFTKTKTAMGQRAMRKRLLYPIADGRRLTHMYDELDAIGALSPKVLDAVERALSHIADLPRLHRRIVVGQLTAMNVLDLDQSYSSAETLKELLAGTPLAAPTSLNLEAIRAAFSVPFSVEKAKATSEDQTFLQEDAAPDVAVHERTIAETYKAMNMAVESLESWAELPASSLRLEFRETLGPILQGPKAVVKLLVERLRTKAASTPFPGIQIQEKKSATGIEVPHLQSLFRAILTSRQELAAAFRAALPPLCYTVVAKSQSEWDLLEEWICKVDVSLTLWKTGQELGFVRPLLVADDTAAAVSIEGLRHPLIEAAAGSRVEYVRHTVKLGPKDATGWLVYGMNASGKSSLMKAVGIAVLLAQAGSYVPASSMTLTPFRGLYTRILNTDNLWAGLSSFAVEMTELREILARADQHSLVLGDELCSGTESISATAIVGAGIQWLHGRNARFIFATHLHGLMDIPSVANLERLRVWHLKVHYDIAADRLIYDRTLAPGAGSSLYGLEVARAMNIPDEILTAAHSIRRGLLGTATEVDAPVSAWNSAIQRRICEQCGAAVVRELEVHHIQPRASANRAGRLADGTHQNHVRNLIVLCAKCHDTQHSNTLIQSLAPVRLTSDGPMRLSTSPPGSPVSSAAPTVNTRTLGPKSKWTSEQMECIESMLRRFPTLPPKRIAFDLEREHGIQISVASLRTIRGKL